MKIALDWIAEYLDRPVAAQESADALVNAGLQVESIADVQGVSGPTQLLDVEVTSNRTDCLSHIGLARELAVLLGRTHKVASPAISEGADAGVKVEIEDAAGCSYYSARVIRGVKVGPSPAWLKARVESIGLRSINNVVDVTNFVLMEIGQPLHAFDLGKLRGGRIVVRRGKGGEKIVAINGNTYEVSPDNLVIADAENAVAIAGVMGGKDSEVGVGTTDILLESARFDPLLVRSTARQYPLNSDSSYRFERGIDATAAEWASKRACELIAHITGGTVSRVVIAGSTVPKSIAITLRLKRIKEILGIDISAEIAMRILAALGFSPAREGETIKCAVPSHRLDVEREIDLIEEIARVHGYKHLPVHDRVVHSVQPELAVERATRVARAALIEAGYSESITVSFIPRPEAAAFLPKGGSPIGLRHSGWKEDYLRPSVLPSLLAVRRTNQYAGTPDARVFEIAETFWQEGGGGDAAKNTPSQKRVLAIVGNTVTEVRGVIEAVVSRLNSHAKISVTPAEIASRASGAAGIVHLEVGGKRAAIGDIGLFTAALQKQYDLRQSAAGAEVDWDALLAIFETVRRGSALPIFPGVDRDLSVVVDETVRWADVESLLAAAKLDYLQRIDFVGTFRNKQIGAGKKSLTLSMNFRDPAATLRSEQVDSQVASAVKLLGEKFAAVLRA